jgi:3-mercaptopyruvate sulfurtransferase SseA
VKRSLFFVLASLALLLATQRPATADPSKYPQFAQQSPPANVSLISVDELVQEITAGKKPMIIDVRSEEEYREVHILGALSAPLPEFNAYSQSIPKDRLVILY